MEQPQEKVSLTLGEFQAMPETTDRIELIDGVLVLSPTPKNPHQDVMHTFRRSFEKIVEFTDVVPK